MSSKKRGSGLAIPVTIGLVLAGYHIAGEHHTTAHTRTTAEVSSAPVSNVALGRHLAAHDYGWRGYQFTCLDTLWSGESGWRATADTRRSGLDAADAAVFAYGIPQARGHGPNEHGVDAPYPSSSMSANPASLGGSSNPKAQIQWGLHYIHDEYGSPCAALAFKRSHGNEGY